jgi:hypothetical protein
MRNPMTLMFALATGLAGHVAAAQGPGDQPTLRPLRPETSIWLSRSTHARLGG